MIRVIYVGSYDCEPKYIVRVNSLVQQPFIAMLCKPHSAEYNIQYLDYDIELMMDSKDQTTRRNAFDRLRFVNMKLLVINGNGYSIFPPSGAWFFLSEQGFLAAPFTRSPRRSLTSSIYISTRPSWSASGAWMPTATISPYSKTSGANWRIMRNGNYQSYSR